MYKRKQQHSSRPKESGSELMSKVKYIVDNNPRGVISILHMYGFPSPQNAQQVYDRTRQFILQDREKAFDVLLDAHPDKDLIIEHEASMGHVKMVKSHTGVPEFFNFTGESEKNVDYSAKPVINSNNAVIMPETKFKSKEVNNFMVLGILLVIIYLVINYKK